MCTQNNMDNTNNIPQNIEYMCVWTPQDIFLKLSGNEEKVNMRGCKALKMLTF